MAECTVMTWNVENLFPHGHKDGPPTREIYERKLRRLAETVHEVAPDVLALQEIGDLTAFADLVAELKAPYEFTAVSQHPDGRGIRVAVISRRSCSWSSAAS